MIDRLKDRRALHHLVGDQTLYLLISASREFFVVKNHLMNKSLFLRTEKSGEYINYYNNNCLFIYII